MNLKSPSERIASIRRKECMVESCTRPLHGFGFCRERLTEMDNRVIALRDALYAGSAASEEALKQ